MKRNLEAGIKFKNGGIYGAQSIHNGNKATEVIIYSRYYSGAQGVL